MSLFEDVRTELAELDRSARSLRNFALTVGGALVVVAGWALLRRHAGIGSMALAFVAVALIGVGVIRPLHLRPLHRAWMAVALSLGWIVSRTLLTVLFFVVITPLAGVTRLFGSRFLETQRDPAAVSYWTKRVRGKTEYEKMS